MKFPVIAILGLAICTAVAQDTAAILDKLRKEQQTVSLRPAQLLKQYTATQKPDGSWEDIDYRDRNHSLWAAAAHIRRTLHLAQAWAKPGQPMFHDETVGRTVRRAVDYWSRHRFQCGNWWWNEIGIPERMANILIAAPELFHDSEERRNALAVVRQTAFGKTGQNRVWQAEIVLKRALLEQDEPTARHAAAEITSELQIRNGEGIQEDGSFHQHGRQLQLGNYGLGFLQSMSYWNRILAGTPLAFPPERTEALRHLVLNGYRWVIWNGRFDLLAQGRQIGRNSQTGKAKAALRAIAALQKADPESGRLYAEILRQKTPFTGNRHFFNSDYMVHRRPSWYASVRMNSTRTVPVEDRINWENALGRYFSDGVMLIMRSGDEYRDITACWDWTRLPGTTLPATPILTEQECRELKIKEASGKTPRWTLSRHWRKTGESEFTGGVSDGTRGVAVYTQNLDGVSAKKAYFFDYDAVYALGCGISSTSPFPVATTVENSLRNGEIKYGDGWFWHNGIGYRGTGITNCSGFRNGDWRYVDGGLKTPSPDRKELFVLQIRHGIGCRDASYSYVILPDVSVEDTAAWKGGKVLANTPDVQAVEFADGTRAAVFHKPGSLGDFSARKAGLYLIRPDKVLFADPASDGKTVSLNR